MLWQWQVKSSLPSGAGVPGQGGFKEERGVHSTNLGHLWFG